VREPIGIYVRLDNLADEEYESALGFSGLPRSIAAGVRFNFAADPSASRSGRSGESGRFR
jgi:hypothetical protein